MKTKNFKYNISVILISLCLLTASIDALREDLIYKLDLATLERV
jgi:hypothetical protein